MSAKKTMIFVDGENLLVRFQKMENAGRIRRDEVRHERDRFVWQDQVASSLAADLARILYYTATPGDAKMIEELAQSIAGLQYVSRNFYGSRLFQVVPRVFHKEKGEDKSRHVDLNIIEDVLRFAHSDAIEHVFLVSGDGDYLPLIKEVMNLGKRVTVAALSSGLHPPIRHQVDEFVDLDRFFFAPKEP